MKKGGKILRLGAETSNHETDKNNQSYDIIMRCCLVKL